MVFFMFIIGAISKLVPDLLKLEILSLGCSLDLGFTVQKVVVLKLRSNFKLTSCI